MSKRFVFPTPLDATVTLRHDNGAMLTAVPDIHPSGRSGQSFDLAGLPNGNGAQITYAAPGYLDTVQRGTLYVTGNTIYDVDDVHLVPDPAGVHSQESGQLRTSGINFITDKGAPWFLYGYSVHLMPVRIYNGENVGPIMDEAKALGANTLIPICTHLSQWKIDNGYLLNPLADLGRWQGTLGVMFDLAAARGLRVAPAILADCQGLNLDQQRRIVAAAAEVAKNRWNVLFRIGNEDNANGWNGMDFNRPDVGNVLCSRGSRGINVPPHNAFWDFAEWESRRDPIYKAMDDAGAGMLELQHGYDAEGGHVGPFLCPLVNIEGAFFNHVNPDAVGDSRWTDPKLGLLQGLNAGANCAGLGSGTSAGLDCRPNEPLAAECMRQVYRGARAAFLR